jgi:hypothetical protein
LTNSAKEVALRLSDLPPLGHRSLLQAGYLCHGTAESLESGIGKEVTEIMAGSAQGVTATIELGEDELLVMDWFHDQ